MSVVREISLDGGKYVVRFDQETYGGYGSFLTPLRGGVPWEFFAKRDDQVNGGMGRLSCELARRVMELEDRLKRIANQAVCVSITSGDEHTYMLEDIHEIAEGREPKPR